MDRGCFARQEFLKGKELLAFAPSKMMSSMQGNIVLPLRYNTSMHREGGREGVFVNNTFAYLVIIIQWLTIAHSVGPVNTNMHIHSYSYSSMHSLLYPT